MLDKWLCQRFAGEQPEPSSSAPLYGGAHRRVNLRRCTPPASPVRLSGVVYLSLASSSLCPMTRRVSRNGSRQRLTPSLAYRQDRPERRELNRPRKGFDPNLAHHTNAAIPIVPNEAGAVGYTSRLCAFAAAMKLANSGCGSNGRDFSSGWNCTPTNQG